MHVLVAGGAGYVGARLVPELLKAGYEVTVLDLYIYGEDVLEKHPKLKEIKGDIRDLKVIEKVLKQVDAVIHLACISNDPSFELNPMLGKSINLDSFEPFVKLCKKKKIKRFIYASSSSVYGIKSEANVTEDMSLEPLTDYSKFKAACEKILFKYADDDFICTVLRPATVCGYSPRQRLDVIVNILTNLAYNTGTVKITGGSQMRPNIHIEDMVNAYIYVLGMDKDKIQKEIFNVGFHNHTVEKLGSMVADIVSKKKKVEILKESTNDNRSYHISSQKIIDKLGFKFDHSIEEAISDLIKAFEEGKLVNTLQNSRYFNIKTMKEINLK
jgi:nucleoside-diphosphate-sugar epimerase